MPDAFKVRQREKRNHQRKGDTMKRTTITVLALLAAVTPAFVSLFMAFGLLIVLFQLVPGAVLFCSIIKTLFGASAKKFLPATGR
jgi:small neutral amino acid transporter SnatA (MarC family)